MIPILIGLTATAHVGGILQRISQSRLCTRKVQGKTGSISAMESQAESICSPVCIQLAFCVSAFIY